MSDREERMHEFKIKVAGHSVPDIIVIVQSTDTEEAVGKAAEVIGIPITRATWEVSSRKAEDMTTYTWHGDYTAPKTQQPQDETESAEDCPTPPYVWDEVNAIRHLQSTVGEVNRANGWHSIETTPVERLALVMREASEAIEEIRDGHSLTETYYEDGHPKGVGIELADVVIRCLDFAYVHGVDLGEMIRIKTKFNRTRGWRHGGKTL